MPDRKSNRCFTGPLALVVLLLVATTVGSAWHHHANSNSEDSCQICHLSHQPIERPMAAQRSYSLIPVGTQLEPQRYDFAPDFAVRRIPARAPPSA